MQIAFTSNMKSEISGIIRYFTEDKATIKPVCSHCLPILGKFYGLELGLSADELLINIVDFGTYRTDPNCVYRIYEIPDVVGPEVWVRKIIHDNNQKVYPHFELLWFIYDWAKDKIIPHNKKDENWINYSVFCSELTVKALQHAGYSGWFKGYDANSITPAELETLVAAIPGAKIIESKGIE